MFQPSDHYHNLSLRLSEVLDDIGVNETCTIKTRRMGLLYETLYNVHLESEGKPVSRFIFGSQTEGTTTLGLNSDADVLITSRDLKVLQDWPEWEPDNPQLLLIQNDTTSPGYCLLQLLRPDMPLPVQVHDLLNEDIVTADTGRVLLKHSAVLSSMGDNNCIRHGPAERIPGEKAIADQDYVTSLHCPSWPKEALPWLQQQSAQGWPTQEIKLYSAEKGCFVVPVASRSGIHPDTEWRISTSHAERCLVFSLNITQIRCYILMKMIIKTFLDPVCKDVISSYICKTLLFHCVADSEAQTWRENNIITCFTKCLEYLLDSILTENCSHFIITGNNLLAGKLTPDTKHKLGDIMCKIMGTLEESLLAITIDKVGNRLRLKSGRLTTHQLPPGSNTAHRMISIASVNVAFALHRLLNSEHMSISKDNCVFAYRFVSNKLSYVLGLYASGSSIARAACSLYSPFLCTQLGSIIASADIQHSRSVSPEALWWFSVGLNSDVSSSKLKLASALFCAGEVERCEGILRLIEAQLGLPNMFSLCRCYDFPHVSVCEELERACFAKNEEIVMENMAFCVRYLPCEAYCTPVELTYEMCRSTPNDLLYRSQDDFWMDWAVIDSKPFMYFLQYKVYSRLQRPADQQTALSNLMWSINNEINLAHKETALNLLGQCFEQENKTQYALNCYVMSLNVRPRTNAAKWHVCKLLAKHQAELQNSNNSQ